MSEWLKRLPFLGKSSLSKSQRDRLFEFIWENHSKRIYYYISHIIPVKHLFIDDIFQEIMIKIYQNLHLFNPVYPWKPWLYKITRNHCLNFIKSKNEKMKSNHKTDSAELMTKSDPESDYIRKEWFNQIDQFFNSLETGDKEIFYLRFYENFKYKKIGEITGTNINTIKSRIRLIRSRLKNITGVKNDT
jgi:RNA polymerase sigma-70 factor (ECF subfamily)